MPWKRLIVPMVTTIEGIRTAPVTINPFNALGAIPKEKTDEKQARGAQKPAAAAAPMAVDAKATIDATEQIDLAGDDEQSHGEPIIAFSVKLNVASERL